MRWSFDLSKSAPQVAQSRCDSAQLQLISYDILKYIVISSYPVSQLLQPKEKEIKKLLMIAICLLKLTKSPGSGPGVKKLWKHLFSKIWRSPKAPPGISWEVYSSQGTYVAYLLLGQRTQVFQRCWHCLVSLREDARQNGGIKPPGVDPTHFHEVFRFLFLDMK